MCLPVLGLVHLQYRPFSLDVPSPRRVLLRLFQSLFHIPIIVYHFVSSGSSPFSTALQPILLLTLSKYYCVAWHNLFLLALYTQTGGGSWFPYAPRITCICHIPLIFFHALVSIIFSLMRILAMFSWGQYYISNNHSFLHYIALACHFEAPSLPNFYVYSFFVLHSRPFSVFSILLSIQCNFLHQ